MPRGCGAIFRFWPMFVTCMTTLVGFFSLIWTDATASHGGAPAMVWQRGAVSGTEALQQQHADPPAQVRSTVNR